VLHTISFKAHTCKRDTIIFCYASITTIPKIPSSVMLLWQPCHLGGRKSANFQHRFHDWMVCVCSQAVWNFQKTTLFEYMPPEKLCFAGRVGKTSLVLRYVENVFSDKQVATVQASYLTKRLTVDGQSVTLSIWVRSHTYPSHAFMFLGFSSRYWW